jgi:Protein of unknown function (DUF3567)
MHVLYDSDVFTVVHMHSAPIRNEADHPDSTQGIVRHGFEIVDKRSGKEVYLEGAWAEFFQRQIDLWQQVTPTEEEVESMLEQYAVLAQTRVVLH